MVKLYDNLLQIFKQLIDIEASNPDFKEIKSLECKELAYKFLRYDFAKFLENLIILEYFILLALIFLMEEY